MPDVTVTAEIRLTLEEWQAFSRLVAAIGAEPNDSGTDYSTFERAARVDRDVRESLSKGIR